MKKNTLIRIISVAILLCVLPAASALAWKVSEDATISRGYFDSNGLQLQVPASYVLDGITAQDDKDEIRFVGPTDVNDFYGEIIVSVYPAEIDLSTITAETVEWDIFDRFTGDNVLNLVSKDTETSGGTPMRMHVSYYNMDAGYMGLMYRYDINLGGCYVIVEYNAFAATRTLPDEVPQLPDIMDSLSITE